MQTNDLWVNHCLANRSLKEKVLTVDLLLDANNVLYDQVPKDNRFLNPKISYVTRWNGKRLMICPKMCWDTIQSLMISSPRFPA